MVNDKHEECDSPSGSGELCDCSTRMAMRVACWRCEMKQSKWDVSAGIDWSQFSSGETLIFIECTDISRKDVEGDFTATIRALIDEQGKLHVLENEIIPNKDKDPL